MVQSEPAGIVQVGSMKPEVARELIEGMHEGGINFVSLLPESEFLTAMHAIAKDPRFKCVPSCNESSGVSMCAGAWVGGMRPAMMMGAAGLTVAAYALATVCVRHGIPVLLLVTSREFGDENWIFSTWYSHTTEPFLNSLGFPYMKVNSISELRKTVRDASKTCFAWMKPIAVLLTGSLISHGE